MQVDTGIVSCIPSSVSMLSLTYTVGISSFPPFPMHIAKPIGRITDPGHARFRD